MRICVFFLMFPSRMGNAHIPIFRAVNSVTRSGFESGSGFFRSYGTLYRVGSSAGLIKYEYMPG